MLYLCVCKLNPPNQEILLPPLFMGVDYSPLAAGEFYVLSPAVGQPQTFTRQTPHGPPIYLTPGGTWDTKPPEETRSLFPLHGKQGQKGE